VADHVIRFQLHAANDDAGRSARSGEKGGQLNAPTQRKTTMGQVHEQHVLTSNARPHKKLSHLFEDGFDVRLVHGQQDHSCPCSQQQAAHRTGSNKNG
jgi:hypothetical protein